MRGRGQTKLKDRGAPVLARFTLQCLGGCGPLSLAHRFLREVERLPGERVVGAVTPSTYGEHSCSILHRDTRASDVDWGTKTAIPAGGVDCLVAQCHGSRGSWH